MNSPSSPLAGIYVHWPFCERKCPYCDFHTFGREHPNFARADAYHEALLREIRHPRSERVAADTIYFGGGTPGLMGVARLAETLDALRGAFTVTEDAEITLEVNPTMAEAGLLREFRSLGANRLSVGCQSFDDRFLRALGRDHDAADARAALAMTREAGFENVSLDLMFGLPDQSLDDLRRDLETALEFGPEHLSAYGLTLHEGTPFRRWADEGRIVPAGPDLEADQFEWMIARLAEAGMIHYEISNWSRPGRASRHNSKYWRRCEVHPFGVSAHGMVGGRRVAHPRDLPRYLERAGREGGGPIPEPAPATDRAILGEIMMLALRRLDGVAWSELDAWARDVLPGSTGPFPTEADSPSRGVREFYRQELDDLETRGLLRIDETRVALSPRGISLADAVMERFF